MPPELDSQHFDIENTDDKGLIDAAAGIRAIFEKLRSEMNSIAQRIDDAKSAWTQTRLDLEISKKIQTANQDIDSKRFDSPKDRIL